MLIRNDLRSVAFPVAIENVQKNGAVDSFEAVRGFNGSGGSGGSSGGKSKKAPAKGAAAVPQQNTQCTVPAPAKVTPAVGQTQLQQFPAAKAPAPAVPNAKFPDPKTPAAPPV